MWGRALKIIEMVGHGSTIAQIWGWLGLPALGVGATGWAMTFFSSAVEGWSVTGVWLASLAAGLMAATIFAAIAVGIAYVRSSKTVGVSINTTTSVKWMSVAEALDFWGDKKLVSRKNELERKLFESFEKGNAADREIKELTKNGQPLDDSSEADVLSRAHRLVTVYTLQKDIAEKELPSTWEAMRVDVTKKLNDGILIGKGFRSPHVAGAPEVIVPQGEWRILALDNTKSEAVTKRDGQVAYTGVVIGRPQSQAVNASPETTTLEIIFDASNPGRRFWSIEPMKDETGKPAAGSFWEYRALVKNRSARTLRNVKVTVEAIGPMPTRPEPSQFDINKKHLIDLNPEDEALVLIRRWYNPPIVVGMAIGTDIYGPIKMTASADDVSPIIKLFHFDPMQTPMIFE